MSSKNSIDISKDISSNINTTVSSNKSNKYVRMLKYLAPYWHLFGLSIIFALLINASDLANPYITKIAIDEYIMKDNRSISIQMLGLIYVGAVLSGAVFSYLQVYLLNSIGQKVIHTIRTDLFTHIQRMPLKFFDRNSSGRILTRNTNDVEALNELYSGVLVALFKDIFMLAGIIIILLQMNIKLAMISFSVLPILVVITYLYNIKARWNFKRVRSLIAQINGFLAENISGMKLVQIFNREKEKYKEFKDLNDQYNNASMLEVVLMSLFKPASETINNLAISLLIWYCIPFIFDSTIEIGVLYAFITYVKKFFGPINDLADKYNVIQSASVSAERIFELMDNNDGIEEAGKGDILTDVKGEIEFKHVWFSYNDRDWVLKDVNFKVNPGETIAFVGATGSGKSTIINLIGRFYEIKKGEILIDGVDIRKYRLEDLRRYIAVVMQDVFLFAGDIKSNIRLNNNSISDEAVIQAAEHSNAHHFIETLPGKYDEEVKERGCTLSSGQRQLLSFARAIAFDPAILVLDEATANIDTETEQIIQDSLSKISKSRTTLVIAHRLSTIKNADKIIVIHKGRIRESGRHEELLQLDGIYSNLCRMQYS